MKKQSVLIGTVACSLALAGCMMLAGCKVNVTVTDTSSTTQPEASQPASTQMANPVHEGTFDEVATAVGFALEAPEGATDAVYSYIEGIDGADPMAQVTFKLDGKEYCYRAQSTDKTVIVSEDVIPAPGDMKFNSVIEDAQAFTGVYDDFKASAVTLVSNREAVVACTQGKSGIIEWLDVVPGIMYSLSVDNGATQDLLIQTAEACFVPTQGEV